MRGSPRGQTVLYAVVMLPTLLLVLALSAEVASLQMTSLRLRSAVDLAAVGAAGVVDAAYYRETGRLRLDPRPATGVARELLSRNLTALDPGRRVAALAEITVVNDVPTRDPYSGVVLDRPAVCIRARLPVEAGLLRLVGSASQLIVTATGDAELRP